MPLRAFWAGAGLLYSAFPFCLAGQYFAICPFFWHLKHLPVSRNFCFSLSVRGVKRLASTSIAFGSRWFWSVLAPSFLASAAAYGFAFFLPKNSWVWRYLSCCWRALSCHPFRVSGTGSLLLIIQTLRPSGSPFLNRFKAPCSFSL